MRRLLTLAALAALVGCGAEDPGLWITVEAPELVVGADLDALRIEIVASRTTATGAAAETCHVSRQTIPGPAAPTLELPLLIVVRPGSDTWRCVGLRLTGLDENDEPTIVTLDLFCPDLTVATEETVRLERPCLAPTDCEAGDVCRVVASQQLCEYSPAQALFDATPTVPVTCDGSPLD